MMAFLIPLPSVPKKKASEAQQTELNSFTGLPHFTKSQFSNVELIGVGSYGKVFRVKQGSKHYVVKELASTGKREASLFKKEAALLQSLAGHENIVRIHGFSLTEHAMLLGYESFDFSKVGVSHEPVHCLKDYLQAVDKLNRFSGFHHTQYHLAKDICAGTRFLHEKGIAHRDLKPDNILISNNHYVNSSDVDVQIWWASKPITARLTDFGESRSTLLQTSSLNQTSTSNLYRGSPAYMAPEALLGRADRASLYDLQNMDLWSLGMTLFSLINPDLPYPYALEIEERQGCRTVDVFKECIETGLLPKLSERYNQFHNESWKPLTKLFATSTKFQPTLRPSADQVLQELLNSHVKVQSLLVSQASVTDAVDEVYAKGDMSDPTDHSQQTLNACSFLSLLIADRATSSTDETLNLAVIMQDLILNFPKSINKQRSHERHYSIDEAYAVLLSQGLIKPKEFELHIVCKQEQTVSDAKNTLCQTLAKLLELYGNNPFTALYTCPPYIFAICKPHKGDLSIVDTHPIGELYSGSDTAGVITGANKETCVSSLCCWLFKRMGCNGNVTQELSVMKSSQDILPTHMSITSDSVLSDIELEDLPIDDEHQNISFDEMQFDATGNDAIQTDDPEVIHREGNTIGSSICENLNDKEDNEEEDVPCKRRKLAVTSNTEESSESILIGGNHKKVSNKSWSSLNASLSMSISYSDEEPSQKGTAESSSTIGSGHYFCDDSHWHMDREIPVFQLKNKVPHATNDLFNLIFDQERHVDKKCSRRPLCVRQDAIFLLDLKHIDHKDIRADGNGTYAKELRHYRWVVKYKNGKTRRVQMSAGRTKDYILQDDEYFLYWNTYSIPKHGLRRQINWIINRNGAMVNDVAFLQYTLPAHVTAVHFIPEGHGNSKTNKSFSGRLSHSSLEAVKRFKSTEKPSTVVREFQKNDPLMRDPCSLPSPKSVYNCRYRQSSQDPLQDILDFNEELPRGALIGHHGYPGITLVFQTENMKNNARFLEDGAVLEVDTTFGQHNFYVTIIATQDKSLIGRDGRYPWVMIAVSFHEQKTTFVHELIVHDIVSETLVLKQKKIKPVIITDAETSIWKSWKPYGKPLRCCNHFQQNFKKYLQQDLHIPKSQTVQFVHAVFKADGLIECEDQSEFVKSLESLREDFNHWETSALNKADGYPSKAYSCLLTRSDMISKRILKGARRKAGYPIETRPNTNGIEAFNHRLKQVQGEMPSRSRKLSYVEYFTSVILVIEKDMETNFSKALIGHGSFSLSPDYEYMAVSLDQWTAASSDAKIQFLEKAKCIGVKDAKKKKPIALTENATENALECTTLDVILPHETVQAIFVQREVPVETVLLMISGAEDLLNTRNMISRKPSKNGLHQYLVHSKRSSALYTCTVNMRNVTCDCRGYRSKTACMHSLAVAYKANMLITHLEWLKRQPLNSNKTALLTRKKPGVGQKGGRPKTRPRASASRIETVSASDGDYLATFTKYYHNNEPFTVITKENVRKDRYKCWHCNLPFENIVPGPPYNIVILHRAWEYALNKNDPFSPRKVSSAYTDYDYHVKRGCIRGRYKYFLPHMLRIWEGLVLNKVQRELLCNELGFTGLH